jgi:ParB family chromosome partitioning protein
MTTDLRRSKPGLGRGLASLIPGGDEQPLPAGVREVEISRIEANPYQPRQDFPDDELQDLAASIRVHGVLQPVLLTDGPDGYRLVAGERRLRASVLAGRTTIPAVIRTTGEQEQLALALVENVQRADLNPIDAATAFRRLIDEFGLTQEQVAQQMGRSRASIANTLRLLGTATEVQDAVRTGRLSEGHARALASLADHDAQRTTLADVERRTLTVRQTEQLVREQTASAAASEPAAPTGSTTTTVPSDDDPDLEHLARQLRDALGTRVELAPSRSGGRIIISWYGADDLMRLCERLAGGDR